MANEPVEWQYDTWYPTDWLSANLRHTISVIFSESTKGGAQAGRDGSDGEGTAEGGNEVAPSMEVDQVSDGEEKEKSFLFLDWF